MRSSALVAAARPAIRRRRRRARSAKPIICPARCTVTIVETRSDSRRWLIDFQCPRCAGAVSLEETERIFTCAYCRVKLCLGSRGPLECYIPAPPDSGENVLYVPYWRLKGMAFTCTAGSIKAGAVDYQSHRPHGENPPVVPGNPDSAVKASFPRPGCGRYFPSRHR